MTPIDRFMSKLEKMPSGCWGWRAGKRPNGYGEFFLDGKSHQAHRAAWELLRGPIPKGMLCCHKCDNRSCVNPEHLFLGTQKDNMADMYRKGRGARDTQPEKLREIGIAAGKRNTWTAGENARSAKFTNEQAEEIRRRYKRTGYRDSNARELAEEYGVDRCTIQRIVSGRSYSPAAILRAKTDEMKGE